MKTLFYYLTKSFFLFCLKIYNRFTVSGNENIPEDEKLIVIANHCSNLDPIVVGVAFPGKLRYLAKSELFKNPVLGFLIRNLGAIPVSKISNQSAGAALKTFLSLLDAGESILLFPEGSRSFDGKVGAFQGGASLIAEKTGVPVLPAYIYGTYNAMPRGAAVIKPSKINITFGKIIHPSEISEDLTKREARQVIMDKMQNAIINMEKTKGGNDQQVK